MVRQCPPDAERVAAFDLGSNTARGILATPLSGGTLHVLRTAQCTTALGRDLSTTGRLDPEGLAATAWFVGRALDEWGRPERVFAAATAAAREATNRHELLAAIRREAGVDAEVISGEEEGRLSYVGVLALAPELQAPDPVVVDVGGRSTEVVAGAEGAPYTTSLPIGARSLTEMCLHSDPPTPEEAKDADRVASEVLSPTLPVIRDHPAVAAGGTAQAAMRLSRGRRVLGARSIQRLSDRLCRLDLSKRSAMMPFDPERAEIICGGLIILALFARGAPDRRLLLSEGGVREGLLLDRTGATALVR